MIIRTGIYIMRKAEFTQERGYAGLPQCEKKMVRKIYVFEAHKDVSKFKGIFKYYILEIKKKMENINYWQQGCYNSSYINYDAVFSRLLIQMPFSSSFSDRPACTLNRFKHLLGNLFPKQPFLKKRSVELKEGVNWGQFLE